VTSPRSTVAIRRLTALALLLVTLAVCFIVLSNAKLVVGPSASHRLLAEELPTPRAAPKRTNAPSGPPCTTAAGVTTADVDAATRTALEGGAVCLPAGRYDSPIVARIARQEWRLDSQAVLTSTLNIEAPGVRILGGRMESPIRDPWQPSLVVRAPGVTIEGMTFRGGGQVVSVLGVDDVKIVGNDFADQVGTAIFVWGNGVGANRVVIEGNHIQQTRTRKASPISSRGSEDAASAFNRQLVVRDNVIDQGDRDLGWFGIELMASPEALIERNEIKGGAVLVSLPVSDSSVVRGNTFDMRGSPYWGIEIAKSNDVLVTENQFTGRGSAGGQTAVSMNSGSMRASIHDNFLVAVNTLVDLTGDHHKIVDNCLDQVGREFAYRESGGPDIVMHENGTC
jgi:parallel beta helix pectate lyase-like protein